MSKLDLILALQIGIVLLLVLFNLLLAANHNRTKRIETRLGIMEAKNNLRQKGYIFNE